MSSSRPESGSSAATRQTSSSVHSETNREAVVVVGLGYIGLPTAAVLARSGHRVIGYDINKGVVDTVNRGEIHIVEQGLEDVVRQAVDAGTLRASTTILPADVYMICVPTPIGPEHAPDLTYVEAAARAVAPHLAKGNLVILESTSPVGTTARVSQIMAELRPDLSFPVDEDSDANVFVAYCPERVLPGRILEELIRNDRVVGGMTQACAERALAFYRTFVEGECHPTTAPTAELVKLTENSFRDVNIAFANELSLVCDELGINVWNLIELANRHPRVNVLKPGPGVGGHCIAVDPWFIVHSAPRSAKLIRAAREVNDNKPHAVVDKVRTAAADFVEPVVACLGLSFKANIDDLRESPALEIVRTLTWENIGSLLVVEPHISRLPADFDGIPVKLLDTESAIAQADIIVLLVDHEAFATVDPATLAGKVVIDTRGVWNTKLAALQDALPAKSKESSRRKRAHKETPDHKADSLLVR